MFDMENLKDWVDAKLVRYVDYALVKWVKDEEPELADTVLPLLMSASYSASLGQVCIDISQWLKVP